MRSPEPLHPLQSRPQLQGCPPPAAVRPSAPFPQCNSIPAAPWWPDSGGPQRAPSSPPPAPTWPPHSHTQGFHPVSAATATASARLWTGCRAPGGRGAGVQPARSPCSHDSPRCAGPRRIPPPHPSSLSRCSFSVRRGRCILRERREGGIGPGHQQRHPAPRCSALAKERARGRGGGGAPGGTA